MKDKKNEAQRMLEYIKRKEDILHLNKEIYEQDKKMVNDYVEFMKEKAEKQKENADAKSKIRQYKELQLDKLKRDRIDLKKKISENKEECRQLKDYKDFIFSLNPSIKDEIMSRKRKHKTGTFVTETKDGKQSNKANVAEAPVIKDEELKEIKEELELSEHDSDTEIPTGFASVDEMLNLMQQKEVKNLSLINDAQTRESSLERARKEFEYKIEDKKRAQAHIEETLKELGEEERRKAARYSELVKRAGNNEVTLSDSSAIPIKEQKEAIRITEAKRTVKILTKAIYDFCYGNVQSKRKRI